MCADISHLMDDFVPGLDGPASAKALLSGRPLLLVSADLMKSAQVLMSFSACAYLYHCGITPRYGITEALTKLPISVT
jgi:hypothetical protein